MMSFVRIDCPSFSRPDLLPLDNLDLPPLLPLDTLEPSAMIGELGTNIGPFGIAVGLADSSAAEPFGT